MDDRSRKLLSPQALPKAAVPDPRAHLKREFKLPAGVAPTKRASSPSLDELRAKALGIGTSPTTSTAAAAPPPRLAPRPLVVAPATRTPAQPIPVAAQGSAPTPAPPVLPQPLLAKLPPVRRAASGTTPPKPPGLPAPLPPAPAPPRASMMVRPPAQVVMPVPQGHLLDSIHWPAIGTPAPGPLPKRPEIAAPVRRASSPKHATLEQAAPPLPPPPVHVVPARASTPPNLVTIGAEGVSFREATSMWFRTGEEEAERAVREAERDAAEANVFVNFGPRLTRTQAILVGACGMLAVLLILALI